jgi:serine protease Do
MRNSKFLLIVACFVLSLCEGVLHAQEPSARRRSRERGTAGRAAPNGKNDTAVRLAFQEALGRASAATVRVVAEGEEVALGAVVEADGYIVTKASVLGGKIICRFMDGAEREAKLVGTNEALDLALLRVEATNLPTVLWRDSVSPGGTLVATTTPGNEPVSVGVLSADLRKVAPRGSNQPRAWLGIGLGAGEFGVKVTSVMPRSPAARAELRPGDEIRQIDGVIMKSLDQIIQLVAESAPERKIKLLVRRGEQDIEISATLLKPREPRILEDEWGGGPFSQRRTGFAAVLAHDMPLHPRDCGGPLVDTDGRAVGINIARALRVACYALPASAVQQAVGELKRKGSNRAS